MRKILLLLIPLLILAQPGGGGFEDQISKLFRIQGTRMTAKRASVQIGDSTYMITFVGNFVSGGGPSYSDSLLNSDSLNSTVGLNTMPFLTGYFKKVYAESLIGRSPLVIVADSISLGGGDVFVEAGRRFHTDSLFPANGVLVIGIAGDTLKLETDRIYIKAVNDTAALYFINDTVSWMAYHDTVKLEWDLDAGFLDLRETQVLFAAGTMELDDVQPATNDSSSSQIGASDNPYGKGYFMDINMLGGATINNVTTTVDTAFYIKKYGARTGYKGLVFDVDTSENTAANVILIDMSGSNVVNNYNDYYMYLSSMEWWKGDGGLQCAYLYSNTIANRSNTFLTILQQNSQDIRVNWKATYKGDFIVRDGNLGVVNLNFIQVQDSVGTAKLNIPNTDIRGQATFSATALVDTVVVAGVTTNSFVFLTVKSATAPTSDLSWAYLAADSITVHCLEADTAMLRTNPYCWFRIE